MLETDLISQTRDELRRHVRYWRQAGRSVALVPTMGALHEGHLSLVEEAQRRCDRVVVSIFLNPAQFAPGEDLGTYPRDFESDIAKLQARGIDLVYAPREADMYPPQFSTSVTVGAVSAELEGAARPHFFTGVATIVAKLLIQAWPDCAIFGEKDYQQLLVIRRMVTDLDLPVNVIGAPTVREADGLAMSSRNAYLDDDARARAPKLYQTLQFVAAALADGADLEAVLGQGRKRLVDAGFRVDYLELRKAVDLSTLDHSEGLSVRASLRLLAAAWLGNTRLIDNVPID